MGTRWSVRAVLDDPRKEQALQAGIQLQLNTVVAQMSHWLPDSDLGRFNTAAAGSWQVLPDAFFEVLTYALCMAQDSDGAYDPAAGALVNLWGFGPTNRYDQPDFHAPTAEAIQNAQNKAGWQQLKIDTEQQRAFQPGGLMLDFSSVAKGYAVDQVSDYLCSQGMAHHLVEVGGELRGAGIKPDGQPWWVALELPPDTLKLNPPPLETVVALHGLAVATSGDYRKYFRTGATLRPHTIDPRTGYPVEHGVASVSVIHTSCMAADALSTAMTVLGVEEGLAFANARGIAARILNRTERTYVEHMSQAFQDMLA